MPRGGDEALDVRRRLHVLLGRQRLIEWRVAVALSAQRRGEERKRGDAARDREIPHGRFSIESGECYLPSTRPHCQPMLCQVNLTLRKACFTLTSHHAESDPALAGRARLVAG